MYALTPIRAVSLAINMSNPIGMMQSLVNLFMYRPGVRKEKKTDLFFIFFHFDLFYFIILFYFDN